MALAYAVPRHLVLRQINAAFGEVDLHVLPEIDELQRRADCVRAREIGFRRSFEKVQQKAPYGVGGAAAVIEQVAEIRIALLGDILGKGADEVAEERGRQGMPAHDARYVGEERLRGDFARCDP